MFRWKIVVRALIVIAICVALYLVYRTLSRYSLEEVEDALGQISLARLAAALGFAGASYLCLTGFDYLGLRYAGRPLAYPRAALASFASLSIGHNVGVAALSSGAVRYRFYSRWGLDAEAVAKVVAFSGATVGLGLATLGGLGLLFHPAGAQALMGLGRSAVVALAAACLALPVLYLLAAVFIRAELRLRRWRFKLPHPALAALQVLLGTINFALVAACLHQLLSAFAATPYIKVAAVYATANATALLSHVPGGAGVLEATALHLLPGASSLAALLAFRVAYFLIPLPFGVALLLGSELVLRRRAAAS